MSTKINTTQKIAGASLGERYIEGIGRRKNAIARVRIVGRGGKAEARTFIVNGKKMEDYFPTEEMRIIARESALKAKLPDSFTVSALVSGGGIHAQAEAVRHGFARALVSHDEELRKRLKKGGLLKRDSRMKERKKFGLKKARKAPQWSKR